MVPMLNLLCTILKVISFFTLLRLFSTAFGWEFGISNRYLALLEALFQLGEKRIEKVQSGQRVRYANGAASRANNNNDQVCPPTDQEPIIEIERPSSLKFDVDQLQKDRPDIQKQTSPSGTTPSQTRLGVTTVQKSRRISTPDGPPVFLLDDDFEDDARDYATNSTDQIQSFYEYQKHEFGLSDGCKLVVKGISAIVDDDVTKRFTTEELKTWNLLTRNNVRNYQFMSGSLGLFWFVGFLIRYTILLPLRIVFSATGLIWLLLSMIITAVLPEFVGGKVYKHLSLMSFRMLSCGLTSKLIFHNRQYRAKNGDICVANHTSPLDVVLLACDNCYAIVGQRHSGFLGYLENILSIAAKHVWFDRDQMKDRQLVTKKLKEYLTKKSSLPILVFPEGTCINNSAVMMFKKGSFETTDRVHPVAMKYDPRFGDPFWNSAEQSYIRYLLLIMSSWAIKCEVWYLPPMERLPGESSAEFAYRVKAEIARQGGLANLSWDGQLKRTAAKAEWKYQQQEDYARRLKLD